MSDLPFLGPALALVLWTFVVGIGLASFRLPMVVMHNFKIPNGVTKEEIANMRKRSPAPTSMLPYWLCDNYNHLHEAPTLFYAVTMALSYLKATNPLLINLAWTYVALRALHSCIQISTNIIVYRFTVFITSQVVLCFLSLGAMQVWLAQH